MKKQNRLDWANLPGCSLPLAISETAKEAEGLVIVLTQTSRKASDIERELKVFLPKGFPLLHFPDRETLPYDTFSPHEDIISDRLLTLSKLPTLEKGLLIVPIPTLLHRLPPH